MRKLLIKNRMIMLFSMSLLFTLSTIQGATSDKFKSQKLIPQVKVSSPSISVKPSGKKLFIHVNPSPTFIELYSGKRRLTKIKGNNRTQFEITRYAAMAADDRLLVLVKDKAGKQHKKYMDVAPHGKKPFSVAKPKRKPASPERPARNDRIESGASKIPMNLPRQNNTATSTGHRHATAAGMMTQPDISRFTIEGKARITRIQPRPATVGKNFTLHGEHFGATKGTVSLEAAGLTLRPPVVRWSNESIEITVPEGLASLVGYDNTGGRIWIYTADRKSGATDRIEISPDHASLPPQILNSPLSVEPGDEITIEGQNFLIPAGTVSLVCPGGGISTQVSDWNDARIRVTPAANLSKPVKSNDCKLTVTNHRGISAERQIRLNVVLKRETWKTRVDHDFSRRRYRLSSADLENGWTIVDSSFEVKPKYNLVERFFWLQQPPIGGRAMRGVIDGELKTGYGRPLGTREITFKFTIEGPAKLHSYR